MLIANDKQNCCGCGACIQRCTQQCIRLKEDDEGFLYPEIDQEKCIDCGLCEKVCPVVFQGVVRKPLHVYAAKNPNEEIRAESSSGGIFTLLSEKVLSEGGVVFGARFDACWEVIHDYTENIERLADFRGSKYVQSRIGTTFQQAEHFLKTGRKVLFSGTPCQIAGLKLFLRKEYDNLLTLDFICHGVPSPGVWREYLKEIAVLFTPMTKREDVLQNISSISFRNKVLGWKKFSLVVRFSAMDREGRNSVSLSECFTKNIFMRGFLADLYLRPSCYACPAKELNSGSDLTIGDFWGIENFFPEFDDDCGVSVVLLNTERGIYDFSALGIECPVASYEDAISGNPALVCSVEMPRERSSFFSCEREGTLLTTIEQLLRLGFIEKCKRYIIGGLRKVKKLIH